MMSLDQVLILAQVVLALLLIAAILSQNRSAGLGASFGGDSATYHTKRGLEKRLHQATIALAAAFLGVAILQLFV